VVQFARAAAAEGFALYVAPIGEEFWALAAWPELANLWGDAAPPCDVGALLELGFDIDEVLRHVRQVPTVGPGTRLSDLYLDVPVVRPRAIVGVARNGPRGSGLSPVLFSKMSNALAADGAAVAIPQGSSALDYEGELVAVMGARARNVDPADALTFVAGYTIMNDLTARDLKRDGEPWLRSKSSDGFAPLGPVVLAAVDVVDPDRLMITTRVNGEVRQHGCYADLTLGVSHSVSLVSHTLTLQAGDLVACGTPPGSGFQLDPPQYLAPGDTVEVTVDAIGRLRNYVV